MRDQPKNAPPGNATEAARRAARPIPRRRFYAKATTARVSAGYAVALDGKPVRTPAGDALAAPTLGLAQAIAAEWEAQGETIDPAKMPRTRLANAIIDGVRVRPGPVAAEIERYLASDLVCYRAGEPQGLRERQAAHWDPILAWAREVLGARFSLGEGVVHVAQPEAALAAARAAIPDRSVASWRRACADDAHRLGAHGACSRARWAVGRCSVASRACRRGLEHGAMGPGRSGA